MSASGRRAGAPRRRRVRHPAQRTRRRDTGECDRVPNPGRARRTGFEALVRWTRNGKPVSPVDFIPAAEELGLIDRLGKWVLEEACRTFAAWRRQFPASGLDCITVNVSARQLIQQGFAYTVEQA